MNFDFDTTVKSNILEFIMSYNDRSGSFRKESFFMKSFPSVYNDFINTEFPEWLEPLQFKQKLWHFLNNDYNQRKCKMCGKSLKFISFSCGYRQYCSVKCSASDSEWQNRRISTCIERYGAGSNITKIKETCIQRYGVENVFQSEEVKNSIKETSLRKYGVDNPGASEESLEKIRQTKIKRFGSVEEASRQSYFASQATRLRRYGNKNYNNPIKIKKTKLERYGDENYVNAEKAKQTNMANHNGLYNSQTVEWHLSFKNRKRKFEYDGLLFDSTWEIRVYKYCVEHHLSVIYQPQIIEYYDEDNKRHFYHPDFMINGKLYEVKGDHLLRDGKLYNPYLSKYSYCKQKCLDDNNVTIISRKEIKDLDKLFNI